ncbi:hypothetical protein [Paenibacillus cremeus]|uniref:Lipoprotein n=1 Tax=Paenibacillus cremeus TaxID=2163881 RepID=A0A559KC02_9BACL|nr:hypothetical protein [Paenibacillus cremeus]TVY09619.1 hypothetical protein FPZ49_12845 [Paenibacillus cremeus]
MFKRNVLPGLILLCSTALMAVGCTDHKQLKQDLQAAVQKQEQALANHFSGTVDLKLDASLFQGAAPMAAAMLTTLKDSHIEYSGAATLAEPVRMEATLKVLPKGAASSIDMPLLIKDNKLYLQMPAINKPDEYLMLPLDKGPERLKNTGHLSSVVYGKLLEGINPDWLEPGQQQETLPGSTEPVKRITLNITDKNQKAAADAINGVIPGILSELLQSGLSTSAQTDQWKKAMSTFQVTSPSSVSMLIDNQGFIREQSGKLQFRVDASSAVQAMEWKHTTSDINQTISFTQDEPKQVKSMDDILRLVAAPKK